ncbi:hypothetical protein [Lentzea tibetensis]|uniref:hypothetical protein n=1 Tax=Lentzea tibetensis TaxID=2591470 RepID=UPI001647B79D|nr:hypothetical protein [Lentzea tibetensis]
MRHAPGAAAQLEYLGAGRDRAWMISGSPKDGIRAYISTKSLTSPSVPVVPTDE